MVWRNGEGEVSFYRLIERAEGGRQWTVEVVLQAAKGMGEGVGRCGAAW